MEIYGTIYGNIIIYIYIFFPPPGREREHTGLVLAWAGRLPFPRLSGWDDRRSLSLCITRPTNNKYLYNLGEIIENIPEITTTNYSNP